MPLSYSKIQLYQKCPKQFEFACVKKIPRQITPAESFGSSVHITLKKWGELEMDSVREPDQLGLFAEENTQPDLDLNTLLSFWQTTFSVHGFATKTDAEAAREKGIAVLKHYFDWWQKNRSEVIGVEKGFTVRINDEQSVTGRFDRLERIGDAIRVVDYKTSKPRSQEDLDADLQLSIYALAVEQLFGQRCDELSLLFLREDGVFPMKTMRTADQLNDALSQVRITQVGIDDGNFDASPDIQTCGRCPYASICPSSVA